MMSQLFYICQKTEISSSIPPSILHNQLIKLSLVWKGKQFARGQIKSANPFLPFLTIQTLKILLADGDGLKFWKCFMRETIGISSRRANPKATDPESITPSHPHLAWNSPRTFSNLPPQCRLIVGSDDIGYIQIIRLLNLFGAPHGLKCDTAWLFLSTTF